MHIFFKKSSCIVLMYHRIRPRLDNIKFYPNQDSTVFLDEFEKQIKYIKNGFNILNQDQFLTHLKNKNFPERSVLLTFDDGQIDFYEYAYPILKQNGVPAVVFLPTDYIDTERIFWWDRLEHYLLNASLEKSSIYDISFEKNNGDKTFRGLAKNLLNKSNSEKEYLLKEIKSKLQVSNEPEISALKWEHVKEMLKNGIDFGGHTKNHVLLSMVDDKTAKEEIFTSKKIIDEKTNKKTLLFAYPYGYKESFLEKHKTFVKEAGYECAFSTFDGFVNYKSDIFALPRVAINGYDDLFTFKLKLTCMPIIIKKILRKGKYIFNQYA